MRENLCPICEAVVLDYEPGKSAVKVDGTWYHPSCLLREGIAIGEAEDHDATNIASERVP